jgi:hypothetical protein
MKTIVCGTGNLSEKLEFQIQSVEALKAEIAGTDHKLKTRYIREFDAEFDGFERVASYEEILEAARSSRIVYVGDYHAVPSCQEFQARLLEDLGTPVVLALEMLYGCDQRALDDWLAGRIEDERFLRRVRYSAEWGYEWQGYRRILEVARHCRIPVFGVDCAPRNDLRLIHRRDGAVAARLVDLLERYPGHTLLVCFGESHLASNHLPAKVARRAAGGAPGSVTILQNVDEIYWKVTSEGLEHEPVVLIREGAYCVFNTTPYEKYEAYRRQLEIWRALDQDDERLDLTSTVYTLINSILRFTRIDKYSYCLTREGTCIELLTDGYPEVYSFEEFDDFESLLRSSGVDDREVGRILDHVMQRGSCYVPRVNAIFIGQFNLTHGAEEAAHFVNFALKGQRFGKYRRVLLPAADEFYLTVLEEALGYFGSKLIEPRRNHFEDSAVLNPTPEESAHARISETELRRARRFVLAHKKMESGYKSLSEVPPVILRGLRSEGAMFHLLAHEIGYLLGEQLYRGYLSGAISRREIRTLFKTRFEECGPPAAAYFDLVERTGETPVPQGRGRKDRGTPEVLRSISPEGITTHALPRFDGGRTSRGRRFRIPRKAGLRPARRN